MTMNYAFPHLGNVTLPYAGGVDIEVNDLVFLAPNPPYPALSGLTANNAYPAASLPDQGTSARNQRLLAKTFAGVSVERHLSTASSANDELSTDVCPVWIGDATIASGIYLPGQLVGAAENSGNNGIQSQAVALVTDPDLAIGMIIQDTGGVAVTSVRVMLQSNLFNYGPSGPQVFEGVLRETAAYSALTGSSTTGTYTFTGKIPTGAIVTGWRAYVATALAGPSLSNATVELGVTGTLAAFSGNTSQSVFATGPIGSMSGNTYGAVASELSPVATFALTGCNANALTAGSVVFEIFYIPPMSP
ncbi:MAG TPA: hypothetical protein VG826_31065 [Pirellulales bacterium]|nr:hypothetical protein [Pirellulales bacterium]